MRDVASATAATIVLAKSLYLDAASCGATAFRHASDLPPAKPTSVKELDRLFLAVLGEYFPGDTIAPGSTDNPKSGHLAVREWDGRMAVVDNKSSNNIRGVLKLLNNDGIANAAIKCANMERVLNDWRMSFFGANPTYADFAPLDFDGDGKAVASCYTGTVSVGGQSFPGSSAANGIGSSPDHFWSLTGYFVLERGRFWRVLTRGEVFDERLKKPIAESNYESVFAIDPDGNFTGTMGSLGDSSMLYQRWITNNYRGF